MTNQRLPYLLSQYLNKSCSAAELEEFYRLVTNNENEQELCDLLEAAYTSTCTKEQLDEIKQTEMVHTILHYPLSQFVQKPKAKFHKKRKFWIQIASIAAVMTILSIPIYLCQDTETSIINTESHDIRSGRNAAILIMHNGTKINLSEMQTGVIINRNKLTYNDGSAVDSQPDLVSEKALTIVTPRGGTYQVSLPDGTRVWLNAASSLTYKPLQHDGIRKVKLTGEAYFEVTKDKSHPFIVETAGQHIQVLGTNFNVSGYADEKEVKTSLLEGSISVTAKGMETLILKEGQQSVLKDGGLKVSNANIATAVGWKNNQFVFEEDEDDIEQVMRVLQRWYDVDVIYQNDIPRESIGGIISRASPLSEVLKSLEIASGNKINFSLEEGKVFVRN